MNNKSDKALANAWAEGDLNAGQVLVERYLPKIHQRCVRQLGFKNADDACQAIFMVLTRRLRVAAKHPVFVAWLLRVADYVILNAKRAIKREKSSGQIIEGDLVGSTDNSVSISLNELPIPIDEAIATLPRREREVLELHFYSSNSYSEIAAICNSSKSTVASRVQRGIERIRGFYAKREFKISGAALLLLLPGLAHACVPAGISDQIVGLVRADGTAQISSDRAKDWSLKNNRLCTSSIIAVSAGIILAASVFLYVLTQKSALDLYVPIEGIVAADHVYQSIGDLKMTTDETVHQLNDGGNEGYTHVFNKAEIPIYVIKTLALDKHNDLADSGRGIVGVANIGIELPASIRKSVSQALPSQSFGLDKSGLPEFEPIKAEYIPFMYMRSEYDSYIVVGFINSLDLETFVKENKEFIKGNVTKLRLEVRFGNHPRALELVSSASMEKYWRDHLERKVHITGNG